MNDVDWGVRAAAWELAAFSFRCPGAELEGAVASGEWAAAAREIAGALGLALPEGLGEGLSGRSGPEDALHALRPEATRLFVGAPEPAVSPYEGVWRAADDGVQALLFVNPHSMEVERFMRSCGLGRPEGAQAGSGLPGGSPAAAYGAFLEEHARAWMPRFADAVAAESRVPFYRDAAAFLGALVG